MAGVPAELLHSSEDEKVTSLVDVIWIHIELAQNGVQCGTTTRRQQHSQSRKRRGFGSLRSTTITTFPLLSTCPLGSQCRWSHSFRQGFSAQRPVMDDTGDGEGYLERILVQYASFAARCLHGESDPRCLMQLLQLLHALLVAWLPFMKRKPSFPVKDVFDAVAPYYPIQFTPPPNETVFMGLLEMVCGGLCWRFFAFATTM